MRLALEGAGKGGLSATPTCPALICSSSGKRKGRASSRQGIWAKFKAYTSSSSLTWWVGAENGKGKGKGRGRPNWSRGEKDNVGAAAARPRDMTKESAYTAPAIPGRECRAWAPPCCGRRSARRPRGRAFPCAGTGQSWPAAQSPPLDRAQHGRPPGRPFAGVAAPG